MPDKSPSRAPSVNDVWIALSLLSRLPVPEPLWDEGRPAARAAWAYPLAGLAVAIVAWIIGQLAIWLHVPDTIAAAMALMALIVTTGAMHEDGLADCADGFWGGWDIARRLEIMKDSRIGVYGVIALILSLLIRWGVLTALISADWLIAIVPAAMVSRAVMVGVMAHMPHARETGLARSTGQPDMSRVWIGAGLASIVAVLVLGLMALPVILSAVLAATLCKSVAMAKIGGQTGDVLGATQQISEIAVLIVIISMV